jgi:acyl carrier protein
MKRDEIECFVKQLVAEHLNRDEVITDNMLLDEDLGADSLDVVEIVMAMEDKFGIDIPDAELENIKSVGDIINHLSSKLNVED